MEITKPGYFVGNLYDFIPDNNIDLLNSHINTIKEYTTNRSEMNYRFDFAGGPSYTNNSIKEDEIKEREELIKKNNYTEIQRWWEFNPNNEILSNYFDNIAVNIGKQLYSNYDFSIKDFDSRGNFTLYENKDFIKEHEDGFDSNRLCVVLIYLSDDWKSSDGGELVIKNNKHSLVLDPKLGNFAVLDFVKNNVSHEVLKVNGSFKRFTYIHFLNLKESDTHTYKQFKQDKLQFKH